MYVCARRPPSGRTRPIAARFVVARLLPVDDALDALLEGVRELKAFAAEDFDAVVLKGVVRRGDDDAEVRLLAHGEVRHRRRRQDAEGHHVHARRADAGGEGRFQHIRGDARVLTDENKRFSAARRAVFREERGGGAADFKSKHGIERFVYDAADSIRSEIFTHSRLTSP